MTLASIPSPPFSVLHLGPVPIRMYALCIIVGILVAVWLGQRRYAARGGDPAVVGDVAVWAVPFGVVGGRIYHLVTSPDQYFGRGGHPLAALYIWRGGLGIWGAIALGGVGAYIGARRAGVLLPPLADALAPGIVLAQAIGRWGNYFNQELYGRATGVPWALHITNPADGAPGYYQPTFLYESVWCVGVAALVIWADRRYRLGHGRAFALYVGSYTVGRAWIEYLRVDTAHRFFGLRLNDYVSAVVLVGAVIAFVLSAGRHPGRDTVLVRDPDAGIEPPATDDHVDDVSDSAGPDAGASTPAGADQADGPGQGPTDRGASSTV